jgi:hypothetical protein
MQPFQQRPSSSLFDRPDFPSDLWCTVLLPNAYNGNSFLPALPQIFAGQAGCAKKHSPPCKKQ